MFIITHVKELSIWTTEKPFDKKSGYWHFYNNKEDYEDDLNYFKDKYGSKFLFTLSKIEKMYKSRGETHEEDS